MESLFDEYCKVLMSEENVETYVSLYLQVKKKIEKNGIFKVVKLVNLVGKSVFIKLSLKELKVKEKYLKNLI